MSAMQVQKNDQCTTVYIYIYMDMYMWYIECKEETRQERRGGINDGREEQPFFNIHIRLEHA